MKRLKCFAMGLALMSVLLMSCTNKQKQRQQEANNLTITEVEHWLTQHEIEVPEDIKSNMDISEYVLQIIAKAKEGTDVSIAINYTKTRDFIIAVQEAAGYTFDH